MSKEQLIREREKLVAKNRAITAKIHKLYRPIDRLKTDMFLNTQAINRLNREIQYYSDKPERGMV